MTSNLRNFFVVVSLAIVLSQSAIGQPDRRPVGRPVEPATLHIGPSPVGLAVSGTPAQAHISWLSTAGATGYAIERWKKNDPDCCRMGSAPLPGSATEWTDVLQLRGTWVYRVTVTHADGAIGSALIEYVYPEPEIPRGFTAQQTAPGTVVLSWQPVRDATSYMVGGPPSNTSMQVAGTSVTITGVPSGNQTWLLGSTYDPGGPHRAGSAFTTTSIHVAIRGFADIHNHQFANLGFGGKAFVGTPYGPVASALPWCDYVHGAGGTGDALGNVVKAFYGNGLGGHRVGGFPQFDGWPRWDSITHQSVHEDWLLRAHQGGLQLLVMLAVNNKFFCQLADRAGGRTCGDSEAIQYQLDGARQMEAFIDAKSGGAGQGWYRIVRTPAEARRAIDKGQLAVILGIEVDEPVCEGSEPCTAGAMLDTIDDLYRLGVRHVFPIHFLNNAIGGASFDKALSGSIDALSPAVLANIGASELLKPYQFHTRNCSSNGYQYSYGRCNADGLSARGKTAIKGLMSRAIIVDVDHMSELSFNDAIDLADVTGYPVVSGHAGFVDISVGAKSNEGNLTAARLERVRASGGMVAIIPNQGTLAEIRTWTGAGQTVVPHTCGNSSETIAQAYLYGANKMKGGPVAFGTDMNGFAGLPGPRYGNDACPGKKDSNFAPTNRVSYPFTALANRTAMPKSVVGQKAYTIDDDGLAHIGMLPDLVAEFQNLGIRDTELEPLMQSAEGYIAVWERAIAHAPAPEEPRECFAVRRGARGTRRAMNEYQSAVASRQIECQSGTGAFRGQGGRKPRDCITEAERAKNAATLSTFQEKIAALEARKVQLACFE